MEATASLSAIAKSQAPLAATPTVEELLTQVGKAHEKKVQEVRSEYEDKLKHLRTELQRGSSGAKSPITSIDEVTISLEDNMAAVIPKMDGRQPPLIDGKGSFSLLHGWTKSLNGFSSMDNSSIIEISKKKHSVRFCEDQVVERKWPMCIIRPESTFRLMWDCFGLILITYDLLTIPFNQAFQMEITPVTNVLDMITILFWTFDMIQGFFLGYYTKDK